MIATDDGSRQATLADLLAAVASLDGAFQLEPDEPLDWYVDGQLDRTIMPGRYLVVPLPDPEPEEE